MEYYRTYSNIVQLKIPLKLQRSHWHQLQHFLGKELTEQEAQNKMEALLQASILQVFIKVSKKVQQLEQQGKPMHQSSKINFSPVEKYGLECLLQQAASKTEQSYYLAYLQPILEQFHQHQINQTNYGLNLL